MEPILHEKYPLSKRRISQLQCKAQLTPSPQGFSSLPRVSEAFTTNSTFNPQQKFKKTKPNANRFNKHTHIHKHLQHTPYETHKSYKNTLTISILQLSWDERKHGMKHSPPSKLMAMKMVMKILTSLASKLPLPNPYLSLQLESGWTTTNFGTSSLKRPPLPSPPTTLTPLYLSTNRNLTKWRDEEISHVTLWFSNWLEND